MYIYNILPGGGTGVIILHNAQQTFEAPLGYRRMLLHPLHTSWLCIAATFKHTKNEAFATNKKYLAIIIILKVHLFFLLGQYAKHHCTLHSITNFEKTLYFGKEPELNYDKNTKIFQNTEFFQNT